MYSILRFFTYLMSLHFFFPGIAEEFNVIINGNKKVKDHQICIFESREAIRVATDTLVLREMSISKK